MNKLDTTVVIQIGIIVKDAEKTAGQYAEVFGIPKPAVVPIADDAFANTQFHGEPSRAKGKAAFFDLGPIQMELIEPVGAPSTWEEFLRTRGEGIHHIAFSTADLGEAGKFLASKGMETVQSGAWDGGQYAYIDSSKQLGTILELLHFDK
ncbi:MAG TPA: VOC family protein [Anaerolineales bacterium]|nr:VOC family protein [Anaerolineales bacterium]